MALIKSNVLTKFTGLLILIVICFTQFSHGKWNEESGVISGDVKGYYAYLPALFINHDLKFKHPEAYDNSSTEQIWFYETANGTRFIKYTCGMSILYSPFFFAGHVYASLSDYKTDGFSTPYKFSLALSSIVYLMIALIFFGKFLLRYFNDSTVAITLLILFGGTNAFYYYTGQMTYSHGYSLALIALFMYSSVRWIDEPKFKWSILIGASAGLMVLIRPIDILFVFFLPLFNIKSFEEIKTRFTLFWKKRILVSVILVFFFLMLLPQLLYFKYIFGSFLFYSYTNESFFFLSPRFLDSIFSYRNGWLIYSPLMAFSIIGFLFLRKQKVHFGWYSFVVFFLYTYIIVSWWCWWYVGFGNRAFINLYPLLSIPLAAFIQFILTQKILYRIVFKLIVLGGIILNIFQSYQFNNGFLHWDSMTKNAYWDSFGRSNTSQFYQSYLEFPDNNEAIKGNNVGLKTITDTISKTRNSFPKVALCDSSQIPFFKPNGGFNNTGGLLIPTELFNRAMIISSFSKSCIKSLLEIRI